MIEAEYTIAASYGQKVIIRLSNGEIIIGTAELTMDLHRAKITTDDGVIWIPFCDIEDLQRSIILH
ncbi:hypothetical protein J23TS9_06160 [Paenibacillus sp. J23TS9]|uniref:hypothetical protein n=1 Tax=Paenibacillus sp. J23TS9 TaxID=2807193 RepID=UPI001B1384F0|nr:hypothetical protein [Paenibacillus sp. J23TS9]GIP25486.1 hypothetical protein J23TS9_06160 [Paenibacillus sp. J23TS9]